MNSPALNIDGTLTAGELSSAIPKGVSLRTINARLLPVSTEISIDQLAAFVDALLNDHGAERHG